MNASGRAAGTGSRNTAARAEEPMAPQLHRLFLVVATLTALVVVPDWPQAHLDDPSYWGVVGFLVVVAIVLYGGSGSWQPGGRERRLILILLLGLPVVYVANWARWGGSWSALSVELGGLAVWVGFAVKARTSNTALGLGVAGHGVWDALHFGRTGFIPDWYVAACIAADLGLGAFVLLTLAQTGRGR
jgi:hypothetical protein